MKFNVIKNLLATTLVVTVLSCEKEALEDTSLINTENQELAVDDISLSAASCGNSADRGSLGSAGSIQGDRCKVGKVSGNPGLLDCRAKYRGDHSYSNGYYIYNIVQGNKDANNNTAVRIERGFNNFSRPSSNSPKRMSFIGTLRVDKLPNDTAASFSNDYTYVAQMHGSGTVRDYNGAGNGLKHTSAIWLIRAHRTRNNTYKLTLEYSTKPATSASSPSRRVTTIASNLTMGTSYNLEIHYGYKDRKYNGYFKFNGNRFNVPSYNFTTDSQYFRYGAYRAGKKINATNSARFYNQSKIAWKSGVQFCNP